MPISDYECPACGFAINDRFVRKYNERIRCPECRALMKKLVPTGIVAHVFPADGVYLEHVSSEGKTFRSKKEMKKFAKDNNMDLGYLG